MNTNTPADQPTYYHFHIHIVNVALEAGNTQAVGKALSLDNIISQLETMKEGLGMGDISLTYHLGEASEVWTDIFQPLKEGTMTAQSQEDQGTNLPEGAIVRGDGTVLLPRGSDQPVNPKKRML